MHRSDVQRELRVLAGDPDEHVRRNAGIGLVRVMAEEVAPDEALTALLDDESGAGAGAAAELAWAFPVSARLEEAVSRWEPGTRPSVERCEVLLALGAGGPEVLAEVRRLLLDPETTSAIRVRLLRSIVRSSRTAIALRSELISRLRDATAREERFLAALGLLASSAVASDAPVDEIPHAVPKDDIGVRIAIDLARARIGRSSPDPDLLAEGRTCSFQSVQLRVAQWDLSLRPEDEWAVGVVRDCLRSRVAGLRCEAISGMIMLGTRPSVLASEVERMRGEDEIWRVVQEARRFLAR